MALLSSNAYQLSTDDKELWERGDLSLAGIEAAWRERRDRRLPEYIVKLALLDPLPEGVAAAAKEGAHTYDALLSGLTYWSARADMRARYAAKGGSLSFGKISRRLLRESIEETHRAQWALLESSSAPMPERLRLHEPIMALWESDDPLAREALLDVLREVPLKWGPWRAVRAIFKASVRARDWEVFGVISSRLDAELVAGSESRTRPRAPFSVAWNAGHRDVSRRTLAYLTRLSWRVLRGVARTQPALYPEVAAQVLRGYRRALSRGNLAGAWLYNHILFHEAKGYRGRPAYGAERFYHYPRDFYSLRAYPDLWKRSAAPLLGLLEAAQHDDVLTFTTESLLKDHRPALKALDASWVGRMAGLMSPAVDGFLHTWFAEICAHTQADYAAHGLNAPLLRLLWSPNAKMSAFALQYFKAHPEALLSLVTTAQVMGFAQSDRADLRALGEALLEPRAGHFKLSLAEWTTLLTRRYSHSFAARCVKQVFSSRDLTFGWFAECLNADLDEAARFAGELLKDPAYRPEGGDLLEFYWSLLVPEEWRAKTAQLAFEGLEAKSDAGEGEGARVLGGLSTARLAALLLHPEDEGRARLRRWAKEGWVKPSAFGAEWLKQLLSAEAWRERAWLDLLGDEGAAWRRQRSYDDDFGDIAQQWLLDGKSFSIDELGAAWLLERAMSGDWYDRAYKAFVEQRFEMTQFAGLLAEPPKRPSGADGLRALLDRYCEVGVHWGVRSFVEDLLKERHHATQREHNPNAKPTAAKRALTDDLLTFEVFERLAAHKEEQPRALALHFARLELRRWTEQAPITFARLLPFFMGGAPEVQQALLKALSKEPLSPEARIDPRLPQFEPNELYALCFSPRAQVRDLGLTLIADYPERFLNPERLALLAESSDRRVCEGVAKALYAALRRREVTEGWRPHAQSVAPQSAVAKRQAEVVEAQPPQGKRPEQVRGKRFIGAGVPAQQSVDPAGAAWTQDFLRRTVFRLSPVHPVKEDLGRLTPSTSGWRNKVTLIKALRDLGVRDEGFAALVAPIFEEFMSSRGVAERGACLVALARLRAAHPALASSASSASSASPVTHSAPLGAR